MPLQEEGYLSSGGLFRTGTLGAVFSRESKHFGLTCHHVANCITPAKEYEVVGNEKVQLVSARLDLRFSEIGSSTPDVYNLANLRFDEMVVRDLKEGDEVIKLGGAATGTTHGTFSSITDYKPEGKDSKFTYTQHYEVQWEEGSKFSEAGDCGALYCVRQGAYYIPFAMHLQSDRNGHSYGCPLADYVEYFECDGDLQFKNPPHAGPWSVHAGGQSQG